MPGTSLADFIDGDRLWARHMALAGFGARGDDGVDRPALSSIESQARAQLVSWGRGIGLVPLTDGIANLFLRYEGRDPSLPPVLAGSHLDSQPTGGRFDGAFGVLAALEAVQAMIAKGEQPLRSIEVVAWTNEEGSRFAPGMSGSEVFTGRKSLDEALAVRDHAGISQGSAVSEVLSRDVDIPLRAFGSSVAAFVEPHIEQGPLLEAAGVPIGIVTGIQGTRRYRVRVSGEAAHAGTAPRAERRDALMAAVRMIAQIDRAAISPDDIKLTVGLFQVTPNAPSVVPSEVLFSIDLRHPDNAIVDEMDRKIRGIVEVERGPCAVETKQIAHAPSLTFSAEIRSLIAAAASREDIPAAEIYSAAGHDARQLHYVCPTGMIFIPCRGGISHNPAEWAEPQHIVAGAKVLANVVWQLANQR
jgi:N-carbamoyl-L-amino-acid hydrolase